MKAMKKLFSLVMATAMVLSMAVSAGAAGGTIKITGETDVIYTVYKMFDIEHIGEDSNKYKVTTDWLDFDSFSTTDPVASVSTYLKYDDSNKYVFWQKSTVSASDGAALAKLAQAYATTNGLTSTKTVAVGGTVTVDDDGYYLLVPDDNSACGVIVVEDNETVVINEKTAAPGLPSVIKKVQEDANNTYGDRNTADYGQTMNFQTTITAAPNPTKYVLHDKMDGHFLFNDDIKITRDGNYLTLDTDYTVSTSSDSDFSYFTVTFTDSLCSSLTEGATLVVHYSAKLLPGADTETDHINETWLTHTESEVETNHDTTTTQTYQINVFKYFEETINGVVNEIPLSGAGFKLKDNVNKYYSLNTDGTVSWVDSIDDADEVFSDASGNLVFKGVDAESFSLIESTVPGGFTGTTGLTVSTKGSNPSDSTIGANATIKVENVIGTALPETGGMGTTLFYVAGGALTLGALVLLVTKKRMA